MGTARDVFLFACYTGAAYCDLMELSKKHLIHDDAGSLWLKFNRQKTGCALSYQVVAGSSSIN